MFRSAQIQEPLGSYEEAMFLQLHLLIKHVAVLRLECASYKTDLAQNCLPHLSLCVVKKTVFCPTEFRKIQVFQTADNFFRYQETTQ